MGETVIKQETTVDSIKKGLEEIFFAAPVRPCLVT